MEFNEHLEEEEEEEEIETQLTPENEEPVGNSGRTREAMKNGGREGFRYRECLKNHAVRIGGHAVDGCREFMAAGDDRTLAALQCAACNCHRNFHRKEPVVPTFHHHQIAPAPPQPSYYHNHHHHRPSGYLHHHRPLALPSPTSRDDLEEISNPSSGGGGSRKRFRTKFTQDQKDRMLPFAAAIGWRLAKEHEAAVEQFCAETGVNRRVLKVWMHNNKHTLGKKP